MTRDSLELQKIVGTGNDFLFVDARRGLAPPFSSIARAEMARALCARHFGAGADGLVFIEQGSGDRLKWDFFNDDGSRAEMCGNASRCVGRWAEKNLRRPQITLETSAGLVRIEALGDTVASHLDYFALRLQPLEFLIAGQKKTATLVDTGVPHAVVEVADIDERENFDAAVAALRFHPRTLPQGSNVTFLQKNTADHFSTVTFERGVENFTLSCGTGVLAAAAVGLHLQPERAIARSRADVCEVTTPGGDLKVSFGPGGKGARLEGPAEFVFAAGVPQEFFRARGIGI